MDWKGCIKTKTAKEVSEDKEMIKSLIESSINKDKSESMLIINETTAVSKISLAYDSLRELLEALALKRGFKIYNHECYTAFLNEVVKNSSKGEEFDALRKIRNSINYYGKKVTLEEAKTTLKRIRALKEEIKDLLR